MYLIITTDGHIEERNENKYLTFAFTDKNKELLKKYAELWDEIKYLIKTINGGKEGKYGKYFMKIRFNSDDEFPRNKPLEFHTMTIIIKSVFEENGKYYPQIFLGEYLYEL